MGFLIDVALLGLLVGIVVISARRSVFSAGLGVVVTTVAVLTALFVTPLLSATVSDVLVRPLVEKSVAVSLADMHSAPHGQTAEQTVSALPLGELVETQPEGYLQLLQEYGVSPETVKSAYRLSPQPMTVVHTVAKDFAAAIAGTAVFLLLAVVAAVLLQCVVRRIEQNLPPLRRYHGFKRTLPTIFGIANGLIWSFAVVTAVSWLVPAVGGKLVLFTPTTLEQTDWYSFLEHINPLPLLRRLVWR